MNVLTLKFFDENCIIYEYQPEGNGERGEIVYSKKNDDFAVEKLAVNDENKYYANMAKSKMRELISKKNLPIECIQAWY